MWTYHLDQFGDGLLYIFCIQNGESLSLWCLWHLVYHIIRFWNEFSVMGSFLNGLDRKCPQNMSMAMARGSKKHGMACQKKKRQPIKGRSAAMTCETASTWGRHVKLSRQAELGCSIWRTRALQAHCYFWPPKIQSSAWSWRVNRVKGSTMFYNFISQFELV